MNNQITKIEAGTGVTNIGSGFYMRKGRFFYETNNKRNRTSGRK